MIVAALPPGERGGHDFLVFIWQERTDRHGVRKEVHRAFDPVPIRMPPKDLERVERTLMTSYNPVLKLCPPFRVEC